VQDQDRQKQNQHFHFYLNVISKTSCFVKIFELVIELKSKC